MGLASFDDSEASDLYLDVDSGLSGSYTAG